MRRHSDIPGGAAAEIRLAIAPQPAKSRISFSGTVLEEKILKPGKIETQKRKWMV
jgi:hypothetical protein